MRRFFEMFIIRFVVYTYVFLFSVLLAPEAYMAVGRNFHFVDSYIAEINTPNYGNKTTKEMLDHFNALGNNKAVFYEPKTVASRPIYIRELEVIGGKESIVGQALPLWDKCEITLKKGLDYETYYQVLLHEYLHCLGYTHSLDKNDLMYYSVNYADETNVLKYAKEIEERNK